MNNVSFNKEQFNDTIKKRVFYSIAERLVPFKKIPYSISKSVDYQGPKRVPYPVANGLISHRPKRRKLV